MTRRRSAGTLLGLLAAAAALVAIVAPPASAKIVEKGTINDSFAFKIRDFCGAGIAVKVAGTATGRYQVNSRGPGGFDYYLSKTTVVTVYTDRATGQTATDIQPNTLNKDLSITDNGDGTITIVTLLTGGERTYGNAGKLIAKNSGQVRFQIVYDYVNDVEISFDLIFGSTGTNDDFCEAVLTDWGYL